VTFRIPIPDRRMVAGGVALVVFGVALFTAVVGWVVFFTLSPLGGLCSRPDWDLPAWSFPECSWLDPRRQGRWR